jgi:uncharacterized protein
VIVVADTSVILNLAFAGQERLLELLFKVVLAPPEVRDEFESVVHRKACFKGLQFPDWIGIRPVQLPVSKQLAGLQLDVGEVAAISLACEINADAILIDEPAGRLAAIRLGHTTFGLLGVLLQAKEQGHLASVTRVMDTLTMNGEFYISAQLRQNVLRLAGELT